MKSRKPSSRLAGKEGGARSAAPGQPSLLATADKGLTVVGIGASAGGLEALEELLRHMPTDTGLAFVVVTHQHPGHTSLLPELLGRCTGMPVTVIGDDTRVEPNHVYVQPPGSYVTIRGNKLGLRQAPDETPPLPIDHFFRALAEDRRERAICIVLSGTGTDGTLGLKAVKGESGMAMVQEAQSARYAGMPSSAIATSLADYILPPAQMPAQLTAYANGLGSQRFSAEAVETPPELAQPMQRIFTLLRSRTGHDFSAYKVNTIRRRIERRMNVHQIKQPGQYLRLLQENPHELDRLFRELLISVTGFFRDPEAFAALGDKTLPEMLASRPAGSAVRVWAPGCSSGEEAYTLAIILRECGQRLKRSYDFQVFGTDLDRHAIDVARAGRYPAGIAADVPADKLERYFLHENNHYRVQQEIREMLVFAPQNVVKDPPFTKLDLLSCRNLLIYMNADLQKRLLPIFHYALKPGGLLLLGPSETIGPHGDLFEPVDKRWKIYRRKETAPGKPLPVIPAQLPVKDRETPAPASAVHPVRQAPVSTLVERLLLAQYAPVGVLVNEHGDITYIHGRTGAYLEPGSGQPRLNILDMARPGLAVELSAVLRRAARQEREVVRENIRVKSNGGHVRVDLAAVKLREPGALRGMLLVTFRPSASVAQPKPGRTGKGKPKTRAGAADAHVAALEGELHQAKASLQSSIEDLETANEELKSTNEELQSTNEELQSANEELETSREEMQSLNEELTTVNTELQTKVEDLSHANDDMQNLLNSTDIATVFLDNDLRIKRYTPQARRLIKLIETDVGRPLEDLSSNLRYDRLAEDARQVLRTLAFAESEVQTRDGAWHLMRIMPYRTAENVIDGLVVTFVNIDRVKRAERSGQEARAIFETALQTLDTPMLILDDALRVLAANRAYYEAFGVAPADTEGASVYDLSVGQWNVPGIRQMLQDVLGDQSRIADYAVELDVLKVGKRKLLLTARALRTDTAVLGMILLTMRDVTPAAEATP